MAQAQAIARLEQDTTPRPQALAGEDRLVIEHLRFAALACRAAAHTDMFRACAVLAVEKPQARSAYAQVLVRTLSQALDARPRLFRPGVDELSFDERWLAGLARAARLGDDDSLAFLLRSRVPAHARRNLAFLIHMISDHFSKD